MMSGEYDGDGFEGDLFLLVAEILLCVYLLCSLV